MEQFSWTRENIIFLIKNYHLLHSRIIARELKTTVKSVSSKAYILRLTKNKLYITDKWIKRKIEETLSSDYYRLNNSISSSGELNKGWVNLTYKIKESEKYLNTLYKKLETIESCDEYIKLRKEIDRINIHIEIMKAYNTPGNPEIEKASRTYAINQQK